LRLAQPRVRAQPRRRGVDLQVHHQIIPCSTSAQPPASRSDSRPPFESTSEDGCRGEDSLPNANAQHRASTRSRITALSFIGGKRMSQLMDRNPVLQYCVILTALKC
jgi:hypothetical protein